MTKERIRQIRKAMEVLKSISDQEWKELEDKAEKEPQKQKYDIEVVISQILKQMSISPKLKGYRYLRSAIQMAMNERDILQATTKELYPRLASQYKDTPGRVERAMRQEIEKAYTIGDPNILHKYFGYAISRKTGRPSNAEFIATIADRLQLECQRVNRY